VISVRRAGILPAASFRFHLAVDTLAVQLAVPVIRVRRGLSPPSHQSATTADQMALARHAPCLAHQKKGPHLSMQPFQISGFRLKRDLLGSFLCRCFRSFVFEQLLDGELDATALVHIEHHHIHVLAFFEVVRHLLNTLIGDL